ncbi:hypothetical protein V6N13_058884 [Hibiscus sabdariffa]
MAQYTGKKKQYVRRFSVKHLRTNTDIIDMLASMTKNRQVNVYLEEEVTEVVRTETGDATRDVTEEAIVDVPGCATGDATEEACGDATSDLHEEATADVTGDAIEEASGDATGDDVTGEADDVEVDDSCSEKDSDYVVDDLKMMTMVQKIVVVVLKIVRIVVVIMKGEELHSASESDLYEQKKNVKFPEFNTETDMNKNVTYKWLAKTYLEKYRDDPTYSSGQMKKDVMHDLVYKVSARACKNGYKSSSRPIISIDGCHLKGYFEGTFLAAVGVEANDNIYPIAYAVVETESQSSWDWFMSLLAVDLRLKFITVKHGLIEAMAQVFPSAEPRTCAARATYLKEFEDAMTELKVVSIQAFEWLNGKDPRQWSKSHFSPFCKSDMPLSNLSECFNKMILEARDKPILTLMEMVRTKIMHKIAMKKEERPESYVDHYYQITTQQEIYSHFITPMRGPNQWVEDTTCEAVIEPKLRRPPGRRKKKRVKEADESVNSISSNVRFTKKDFTIYCSKCGKAGHNQRTCKGKVGANMPVNAPKRKENQQSGTSVRLPKLQVKRLTTSPSKTSPFVFIPTPGLASHPTTQQSCPTQQPGSVMTVRLMPTSQEHCSVDQSLSQSSTLTQNVQENKSNEGLGKGQRWCR